MKLASSFTSTGGKFSIYVLMDHRGHPRYVGITTNSAEERLRQHIKHAKRKTRNAYRDRWIRSLPSPPLIHCIEVTDDPDRERYWIQFFRNNGATLTNLTEGGEGISGYRHTPESKAKMSATGRGRKMSDETRARMSAAGKARSIEHREKIAASLRGHAVTQEMRQKISESRKALYAAGAKNPMLGRKQSEASIQKNREAQLKRYAAGASSPRKGVKLSDATKAKLREALVRRRLRGLPLVFKGSL